MLIHRFSSKRRPGPSWPAFRFSAGARIETRDNPSRIGGQRGAKAASQRVALGMGGLEHDGTALNGGAGREAGRIG